MGSLGFFTALDPSAAVWGPLQQQQQQQQQHQQQQQQQQPQQPLLQARGGWSGPCGRTAAVFGGSIAGQHAVAASPEQIPSSGVGFNDASTGVMGNYDGAGLANTGLSGDTACQPFEWSSMLRGSEDCSDGVYVVGVYPIAGTDGQSFAMQSGTVFTDPGQFHNHCGFAGCWTSAASQTQDDCDCVPGNLAETMQANCVAERQWGLESCLVEEVKEDVEEYDHDTSSLEFIASAASSPAFQPPPPKQERQLRGELFFLRAWPIVHEAVAAASAETATSSACSGEVTAGSKQHRLGDGVRMECVVADAVQLCGKVVGMLLQLSVDELNRLMGCSALLRGRLLEALRGLLPQVPQRAKAKSLAAAGGKASQQGGGSTSSAPRMPPGGGPPPEKHGDLLCMALTPLIGDGHLAVRIAGSLLVRLSHEQIYACLMDEKRLRGIAKGTLREFEREEKEQREAHQRLSEFLSIPAARRADLLRQPVRVTTGAQPPSSKDAADEAQGQPASMEGRAPASDPKVPSGRAWAASLLRSALKYTKQPEVVARAVANSLATIQLQPGPVVLGLLEQCGLDRAKLSAMRVRVPGPAQPAGSSGSGGVGGRRSGIDSAVDRANAAGPAAAAAAAIVASAVERDGPAVTKDHPGKARRDRSRPRKQSLQRSKLTNPAASVNDCLRDQTTPSSNRLEKGQGPDPVAAAVRAGAGNGQDVGDSRVGNRTGGCGTCNLNEVEVGNADQAKASELKGTQEQQFQQHQNKHQNAMVPGLIRVPGLAAVLREQDSRPRSPRDREHQDFDRELEQLRHEGLSGAEDSSTAQRGRQPGNFLEALRRPAPRPNRPAPPTRPVLSSEELFPALSPAALQGGAGLAPKQKGVLASHHAELQRRPSRRSASMDPISEACASRAPGAAFAAGSPLPAGSAWTRSASVDLSVGPHPSSHDDAEPAGASGGATFVAAGRSTTTTRAPSVVRFAEVDDGMPATAAQLQPLTMQSSAEIVAPLAGRDDANPVVQAAKPAAETRVPSRGVVRGVAREQSQDHGRTRLKRKGHIWSPVADAFEVARERARSLGPGVLAGNDGVATSSMEGARGGEVAVSSSSATFANRGSKTKTHSGSSGNVAAAMSAQDARICLRDIQEAKMQAVEREDFELAARLKHEEQSFRRMLAQEKTWADVATIDAKNRSKTSYNSGHPSAPSKSVSSLRAASADATGSSRLLGTAPGGPPRSTGGLVFFLPAPGDLDPETFKPTTTHVARRDALARIATAALWRGRGLAWNDVKEVIFLFDDQKLLRITPRFVASCPVPSEYHLVMVLGRALGKDGDAPGLAMSKGELGKACGGHIERIVAEYAQDGSAAAVLLHETYPENLGIYEQIAGELAATSPLVDNRTIIFFLGAVRDMAPEETKIVHRACRSLHVPCVEVSLGQQAEFTSKIIDVLHGHHLHGHLAPAVWRRARSAIAMAGGGSMPEKTQQMRSPKGILWVFVPIGGGPRDLVADDRRNDGVYEVPRCCISQLWCSKGEHDSHMLSFVFASGDVLTVSPTLVTCLKLQHRAAPTERNLVNALRVGMGDKRADNSLVIDDGCVFLGDAENLRMKQWGRTLEFSRTALVDLQLGGDAFLTPRLDAYSASKSAPSFPNAAIILLRQADGRDFPRGFRDKLARTLLGDEVGSANGPSGGDVRKQTSKSARWLHASLPQMTTHSAISLLAHYWHTRVLAPALVALRSPSSGRVEAKGGRTGHDKGDGGAKDQASQAEKADASEDPRRRVTATQDHRCEDSRGNASTNDRTMVASSGCKHDLGRGKDSGETRDLVNTSSRDWVAVASRSRVSIGSEHQTAPSVSTGCRDVVGSGVSATSRDRGTSRDTSCKTAPAVASDVDVGHRRGRTGMVPRNLPATDVGVGAACGEEERHPRRILAKAAGAALPSRSDGRGNAAACAQDQRGVGFNTRDIPEHWEDEVR